MSENDLVSRADSLMQRQKAAATHPPIEDFPILTLEAPLHLDDPTEDGIPLLTEEISDLPLLSAETEVDLDDPRYTAMSNVAQEPAALSVGKHRQIGSFRAPVIHDEAVSALATSESSVQTTDLTEQLMAELTTQITARLTEQLSAQLAARLTNAIEHRLAAELPTLIEAHMTVLEDNLRTGVREIAKSAIQDFMTHTKSSPPSR